MKQIVLIMILLGHIAIYAQSPLTDPHWNLVWADEFSTLNTSQWLVRDHYDHGGEPQMYLDNPENVWIQTTNGNGALVLTALNNAFDETHGYTSGWVETREAWNIKFGYIESRIFLPYGYGLWPAFWTLHGPGVINYSNVAEIDIFEMLGHLPPTTTTSNIHHYYPSPGIYYEETSNFINYGFIWHKYAIEWSPSKITWYIDDIPFRTLPNHAIIDPVQLILNLAIEPNYPPNSLTPFPAHMAIDYVRVYKLNNVDCGVDVNACNYNFSTHDNKVKKSMVFGPGCINTLSPGDNVILRATDEVRLRGDFTVPAGAELYIDVNPCY